MDTYYYSRVLARVVVCILSRLRILYELVVSILLASTRRLVLASRWCMTYVV